MTINLSHEKAHHCHQSIIVITSNTINQNQAGGSRSLPPMDGLNPGKFVPSPCLFGVESTKALSPKILVLNLSTLSCSPHVTCGEIFS
jgi:hypothetical protein